MLPLAFGAGAALLVAGIALLSIPAGLIAAGLIVMLVACGVAKAQETARGRRP